MTKQPKFITTISLTSAEYNLTENLRKHNYTIVGIYRHGLRELEKQIKKLDK